MYTLYQMGNTDSSSSASIVYGKDFSNENFVNFIKKDTSLHKLFEDYIINLEETCINGYYWFIILKYFLY